jgi:hypothetical protein
VPFTLFSLSILDLLCGAPLEAHRKVIAAVLRVIMTNSVVGKNVLMRVAFAIVMARSSMGPTHLG